MKLLILSFVLIFSSLTKSEEFSGKSYGELAKISTEKGLERVLTEVALLIHSTPPFETKKLRKEIGNLKLLLDVFSFAYPKIKKNDHKVIDPLMEFRSVLDEGYEVVGTFKDLADSGSASGSLPSNDELVALRSKAINWKKKILEHIYDENIKNYLSTPLDSSFQNRTIEDLHKYTWRQISLRPNSGIDGVTTLKMMCSEVLLQSNRHLNSMIAFDDLFELEREEFFHSIRKEMRIVLKLSEMIEGIFNNEINNGTEKQTILLAVEKFGAIHDLIMALHRANNKKNEAKIEELKNKLVGEFIGLKNWINEFDLTSSLQSLSSQLQ